MQSTSFLLIFGVQLKHLLHTVFWSGGARSHQAGLILTSGQGQHQTSLCIFKKILCVSTYKSD